MSAKATESTSGEVVVVTGDHRYLAAFALHNVSPLPGSIGTWVRTGEDPRGGMGAEIRIAKALATSEHNARPRWTDVSSGGRPCDDAFCAVQFADGSFGPAIAHSEWQDGFFMRRKYKDANGCQMRQDDALPGKVIRYLVIPLPEPPKEPSR